MKLNLKNEIKRLKTNQNYTEIKRLKYEPYNIDYAIKVFNHIGLQICENFKIDAENKQTVVNLIKWVHGDDSMQCVDLRTGNMVKADLSKGLYLFGSTGTGKTLLLDILKIYAKIDEVKFKVSNELRTLNWTTYRTDEICQKYAQDGVLWNFTHTTCLCLNDLGAKSEPDESMYMGNRTHVIMHILENRGERKDKITLITSNLPPTHSLIKDRYGERVFSRLFAMCNFLPLFGKDRRIEQ